MISEIVCEINKLLLNQCPYSALGMALTLPDICGNIAYPQLGVGERYRKWFDEYVYDKDDPMFENAFIPFNGEICYKLRCAYLHSGNTNLGNAPVTKDIKKFTLHYDRNPTLRFYHIVKVSPDAYHLDMDLGVLCGCLCNATMEFYKKYQGQCANNTVTIKDETPSEEMQQRLIKTVVDGTGHSIEDLKEMKPKDPSLIFDMSDWEFPTDKT